MKIINPYPYPYPHPHLLFRPPPLIFSVIIHYSTVLFQRILFTFSLFLFFSFSLFLFFSLSRSHFFTFSLFLFFSFSRSHFFTFSLFLSLLHLKKLYSYNINFQVFYSHCPPCHSFDYFQNNSQCRIRNAILDTFEFNSIKLKNIFIKKDKNRKTSSKFVDKQLMNVHLNRLVRL